MRCQAIPRYEHIHTRKPTCPHTLRTILNSQLTYYAGEIRTLDPGGVRRPHETWFKDHLDTVF